MRDIKESIRAGTEKIEVDEHKRKQIDRNARHSIRMLIIALAIVIIMLIIYAAVYGITKKKTDANVIDTNKLEENVIKITEITTQLEKATSGTIKSTVKLTPTNGSLTGLSTEQHMTALLEFDNTHGYEQFTYTTESDSPVFSPISVRKDKDGYYSMDEDGKWQHDSNGDLAEYQDFALSSLSELKFAFTSDQIASYSHTKDKENIHKVSFEINSDVLKLQQNDSGTLVKGQYIYKYTEAGRLLSIETVLTQSLVQNEQSDEIVFDTLYDLSLQY